jgi:hypothetical protein
VFDFRWKGVGDDLAMFNLAIDSKLRGCDLMWLRIDDVFDDGCPTVWSIRRVSSTSFLYSPLIGSVAVRSSNEKRTRCP